MIEFLKVTEQLGNWLKLFLVGLGFYFIYVLVFDIWVTTVIATVILHVCWIPLIMLKESWRDAGCPGKDSFVTKMYIKHLKKD